jgi:hypothetical protein
VLDEKTVKKLKTFTNGLIQIVGEDLARSIINCAQRPNELEAVFLKTDGFAGLAEEQRDAIIDLLEFYRNP